VPHLLWLLSLTSVAQQGCQYFLQLLRPVCLPDSMSQYDLALLLAASNVEAPAALWWVAGCLTVVLWLWCVAVSCSHCCLLRCACCLSRK